MKFINSIDYLKTQERIQRPDVVIVSNCDEIIQHQLESIDIVRAFC